jgi:signal transduction histidine kinase
MNTETRRIESVRTDPIEVGPIAVESDASSASAEASGEIFLGPDPCSGPEDQRLIILAHELRGRLHALVLNTEVILHKAHLDGVALSHTWLQDRLECQARALRDLQQIVERLLEVRLAQQLPAASDQLVDLRALVIEAVQSDAEALRSARCDCSLLAPVSVAGRWDAVQLRMAITNLLSNAIKYGAGRPVEISVGMREGQAFVRVSDHGIGLRAEDRERIFERFERVAPDTGSGLGLGLWLVRNIARGHGGDVTVSSIPGKGAAFTLRLPLSCAVAGG